MYMSSASYNDLEQEGHDFGNYIVKQPVSGELVALYCKAIESSNIKVPQSDEKLLRFTRRRPWSIGLIDAGLVLYRPDSEVRRRLFIMFSILETSPAHYKKFLLETHRPFFVITLLYSGGRAVLKGMLGTVLVRVVG